MLTAVPNRMTTKLDKIHSGRIHKLGQNQQNINAIQQMYKTLMEG